MGYEESLAIIGRYPPAVVAKPSTKILSLIMGFSKRSVRHAPVINDRNNVIGMVSARDIINYLGGGEKNKIIKEKFGNNLWKALNEGTAELIMSEKPIVAKITDGLAKFVSLFLEHNVGAIPIVNTYNKLIGIVSERHITDILAGHPTFVRVKEIMSSPVITCKSRSTLLEAMKLMVKHGIRRLAVEYSENLGLVTIKDIISYLASWEVIRKIRDGKDEEVLNTSIGKIASKNIVTINSRADVSEALNLMRNYGVGSLLVMDNGELVGIVTERDIVRKLPKMVGVETYIDVIRQEISIGRVSY